MKEFREEDYLQLAGIQHFSFCKRQWALIHLEQEWAENVKTIEGNIVHEKAHDEQKIEKRGDLLITRGLEVSSKVLCIYGVCDVVEFHKDDNGIALYHYYGTWLPLPIEYKRGKPKITDADRLQLCAQAICLEEIFHCNVKEGALFYDEIKRREIVHIDQELRDQVNKMTSEMHALYARKHTPKGKTGKQCFACSLRDICIPALNDCYDVQAYIKKYIGDGK